MLDFQRKYDTILGKKKLEFGILKMNESNTKNEANIKMEIKYEMCKMHDGTFIHLARFEPKNSPKGVIQIVHGFGEHIDCYGEVVEFFNAKGYICVIHDMRGFGRMPKKTKKQREKLQGIVSNYKLLSEDVWTIRTMIGDWYPNIPVFLYGHSMGGSVAISCLLDKLQSRYEKLILEAPWFALHTPISMYKNIRSRIYAKISHKIASDSSRVAKNTEQIGRSGKTEEVIETLDKEVAPEKTERDEFCHRRISLRLFTQGLDAGTYAIKNARGIILPTLVIFGGKDKVVCIESIRKFCKEADDNVIMEEYPDSYHTLHADALKTEILTRVIDFCEN